MQRTRPASDLVSRLLGPSTFCDLCASFGDNSDRTWIARIAGTRVRSPTRRGRCEPLHIVSPTGRRPPACFT